MSTFGSEKTTVHHPCIPRSILATDAPQSLLIASRSRVVRAVAPEVYEVLAVADARAHFSAHAHVVDASLEDGAVLIVGELTVPLMS